MPANSGTALIRSLGFSERFFHQFSKTHPMNFLLGAEFPRVLTPEQLGAALQAAQKRHPLLSAHVEEHREAGFGFYRTAVPAPVDLTVRRGRTSAWTQVASEELSHPMDTSKAPLMRAVLLQDTASSMLLLSFDHAVADGMAAVFLLKDLLAVLNGRELPPLPVLPPQEELTARAFSSPGQGETAGPRAEDARMAAPSGKTSDSPGQALPPVQAIELDVELTSRIMERCRAERTTVHSLLVVVASRVTGAAAGKDFVRVMTPVNHRKLIGVGEDVGVYNFPVRTGMSPHDGTPLWDQARAVRAEISSLGSLTGIASAMEALRQAVPGDVSPEMLTKIMKSGPGFELNITNLGVVDLGPSGPIHPTSVVGPLIASHSEGQEIISVATFAGRMRICGVSRTIENRFFTELRQGLADAVGR
jgi:hypothetical protein